jgi:hypothetical protein
MDLKEEHSLGEQVGEHWYYRSKSAALLKMVADLHPRQILDVGAGSGFFSKHLLSHTRAESACCIDPFYPEEFDSIRAGKPIMFRRECTATDADLVLMMDVLEHVEDDLALLERYVAMAPAGARFMMTVPAFQFLWSGHDEFLGHHKRYTLSMLVELAGRAGLLVERHAYYFGLVFPLAAVIRIAERLLGKRDHLPASDLKQHSESVNLLLSVICRAELPFFRFNRLAGLSAFCLARKP